MKRLMIGAAALSLATGGLGLAVVPAQAQVVHKQVVQKPNGTRVVTKSTVRPNGSVVTVRKKKWSRGQRVPAAYRRHHLDWRAHHLRQPPRGYDWVEVDGQYVLIAAATGLIAEALLGR
jgi:Ni/Co efflux regulator RcnB